MASPLTSIDDNTMGDSITINKQNNTILNLSTKEKYVEKNIELTLGVRSITGTIGGSASAGKATAAISNVNSMATITTLTNLTAGTDYWAVKATATTTAGSYTPKYTVTTSGWLESTVTGTAQSVSVTADSTGKTIYIPRAEFTVSNNLVYCSSAGYIPKGSTSSGVGTIAGGKVTSGSAEITSLSYSYNSTNGNFSISGSANVSAPTVNTAGYISSSVGTKSSNNGGATVSTTVAKVKLKATSSSTLTYEPAIKRQTFTISGVTDASNAAETTTAPTSGVYVKVKSAANTGTITVSPAVATAGYGTTTNFDATNYTGTIGAKASADTYIPIKTATPAFDGGTISGTTTSEFTNASTNTSNTSGVIVTTSGKASRTAVLFNGAVKGWVDKADNASASAAVNNTTITGATYYITGVDIKASKNFNITIPNGSATSTITLNFAVDADNNVLVT